MYTCRLTEYIWKAQAIKPLGILILLALARYSNNKGTCYPSIETLSNDTGISTRQIMRIIKELEAANMITVHRAGWNKPNVYTFLYSDTMSPEPSRGSNIIDYNKLVNG